MRWMGYSAIWHDSCRDGHFFSVRFELVAFILTDVSISVCIFFLAFLKICDKIKEKAGNSMEV
jgi:hypothetical protein